MSCLSAVSPKWSVLGINIVSSVFSLADRTLEKATLYSGKLDLDLVSAGSNGVEPQASLCADNVTICALWFIQFVVYPMRNPVVYRIGPRKRSVLLTI